MKTTLTLGVLACLIFASALALVLLRYENKAYFMELQGLRKQRDALDREWGQLLLEQGTWGSHARVEAMAREKLAMTVPTPAQVLRVRP
jgi:cell division protein FtsL